MASDGPTFSVVLPTYNAAEFVEGTLDSIRDQEFEDYELIVADDGSRDETVDVVRDHALGVDVLIEGENLGIAQNTNRAAAEASGDYLALLDHDDRWKPEKLAAHAATHERSGAALVYSDNTVRDRESGATRLVSQSEPKPAGDPLVRQLIDEGNIVGTLSSVSVDRRVWERHGGFDDKLHFACDLDFYLRLADEHDFERIPRSLLEELNHSSNASGDYSGMNRDMFYVLDKAEWWYPDFADRIEWARCEYEFAEASGRYRDRDVRGALGHAFRSLRRAGLRSPEPPVVKPVGLVGMIVLDRLTGDAELGRRIYRRLRERHFEDVVP